MSKIQDRIEGGILGLLIGDALGVPYEFRTPEQIPQDAPKGFAPPPDFDRAHKGVPPGTWSDDGAQALCLMASLLETKRFDPNDFAERMVRWYSEGYLAVDGVVFDVGITTAKAIRVLQAGASPLSAGPAGEYDNGNGSLMRVLPLALWHRGSVEELVQDAHDQSAITHGHARSKACCALYCLWARMLLLEAADPWTQAIRTLQRLYSNAPIFLEELEFSIRPEAFEAGKGSGYVVDSLRSAHAAADHNSFEEVMRASIALGHDTDTTACIAGGIAGVRMGAGAIPLQWRKELRGQELYEPLLKRFLEQTVSNVSLIR